MSSSILITGANRGIGLEFVRQLIGSAGAAKSATGTRTIFATYRNRTEANELFELAEKTDSALVDIRPVQLDVCDESSYPHLVEHVRSVVGGLNVLVHNAGILQRPGDLASTSKPDLLIAYEINAVAPVLLTRAFLPLLQVAAQTGNGLEFSWTRSSVIVISALWGSPTFNTQGGIPYAYGMSKAAVNFAVKSLSFDLKPHKILTVAIHPGWVKTRMGGDEAPIDSVESVRQMLQVALPSMTEASTGGFFNYDGKALKY